MKFLVIFGGCGDGATTRLARKLKVDEILALDTRAAKSVLGCLGREKRVHGTPDGLGGEVVVLWVMETRDLGDAACVGVVGLGDGERGAWNELGAGGAGEIADTLGGVAFWVVVG